MEIKLIRKVFSEFSTIGELHIDGEFFCHTLEDKDRGLDSIFDLNTIKLLKEHSKTAIPYGTYKVVISFSPRFKQMLPLLLNVPGFLGIRIHPGNAPEDTEGCLLLGEHKGDPDFIINSRSTFKRFFNRLKDSEKKEATTIQITRDEIEPTRLRAEESIGPWDPFGRFQLLEQTDSSLLASDQGSASGTKS